MAPLQGWAALLVAAAVGTVQVEDVSSGLTRATVDVDASPQALRELLTRAEDWPKVFSDIPEGRRGAGNSVEFTSKAFRHRLGARLEPVGPDTLRLTVVQGPSSLSVWQEWQLTPRSLGRGTHVTVTLHASVGGMMSLVFPEWRLVSLRRVKLTRDLTDLQAWSPRPPEP